MQLTFTFFNRILEIGFSKIEYYEEEQHTPNAYGGNVETIIIHTESDGNLPPLGGFNTFFDRT